MSVLTGLIALAGIVTAIAAICQARAVVNSNKELRASQEIAARQARAVEASNEAFLEAQKKAVAPHLDIEHSHSALGNNWFKLISNGLGPAEIVEFTIYLNGEPLESSDGYGGWTLLPKKLQIDQGDFEGEFAEVYAPAQGSWFRSGQSEDLFKVNKDVDSDVAVREFGRIKDAIGFRIVYRSQFGDEETLVRGRQQG